MTDFIEAPIVEVQEWANGKGGDVLLHSDPRKYYYHGNITKLPIGMACKFEIKEGEDERKDQFEILNFEVLKITPSIPAPPPSPQVPKDKQYVSIPYVQFKELLDMKSALKESRVKSLVAATETFKAMGIIEKDHKAAAQKIIEIAKYYEGYLI